MTSFIISQTTLLLWCIVASHSWA